MEEYRKYEPIFGSWYLSKLIGRGSFGKVYEIVREEYGTTYKAALKIITVPQDDDDIKSRLSSGADRGSVSEYYEGILKEFVNENEIMAKLKGNSNIVSYEDHQIIPHDDGIGYDILIRMELLTPLLDRMMQKKLDEKEVVKLGIDMCRALELCHRKNIIHRDIKPQNIFISDAGDFKLGDFGIARTMEKTTGGMSKKGTYKYMAPEVFRGEHYDSTVDLYSLGIVLFSLLNGNRGPFLPAPPAKVTANDEEEARMRRFRGEPIPSPRDAGVMLSYIIKKACEADPSRRYRTAEQMRRDLESYLANYNELSVSLPAGFDNERTAVDYDAGRYTGSVSPVQQGNMTVQYAGQFTGQYNMPPQYGTQASYGAAAPVQPKNTGGKKRKKLWPFILAGMILVAAVTALALLLLNYGGSKDKKVDLSSLMSDPVISGYDEGFGVIEEYPEIGDYERDQFLSGIRDDEARAQMSEFLDSVSFYADTTEGFSNGDTVTFYAEYDTALAETYGIEVTGMSRQYTVSGLPDLPSYLDGAVEYNGHYYKVVNEAMYWSQAKAECEAQDGHLVTITDSAEQEFVFSLADREGQMYHYWLGATDEAHEGDWRWVTGEAWSYNNWCTGQPNNTAYVDKEHGQDYLEMQMTHGDQETETYSEYGTWTDICDSGIAYNTITGENFEEYPDYNSTKYYGYIIEWDSID